MSEETESKFLAEQIEVLADKAEMDVDKVESEIQELIADGRNELQAILKWKYNNRTALGVGMLEFVGRVIKKEEPRERTYNDRSGKSRSDTVVNVHFALEGENGDLEFRTGNLVDERIESIGTQLEKDVSYSFTASLNNRGNLIRIGKVEEIPEPSGLPTFEEMLTTPLDSLVESEKTHDLIEGNIVDVKTARGSTEIIGVVLGNVENIAPILVWLSGRFRTILPEDYDFYQTLVEGNELKAYGYVTLNGSEAQMRGIRVVRL